MRFEITINFKKAVVFLMVFTENARAFTIRKWHVLSDDDDPYFPSVLELVQEHKAWLFEIKHGPFMENIIPALEHYLEQQQKAANGPLTRSQRI